MNWSAVLAFMLGIGSALLVARVTRYWAKLDADAERTEDYLSQLYESLSELRVNATRVFEGIYEDLRSDERRRVTDSQRDHHYALLRGMNRVALLATLSGQLQLQEDVDGIWTCLKGMVETVHEDAEKWSEASRQCRNEIGDAERNTRDALRKLKEDDRPRWKKLFG